MPPSLRRQVLLSEKRGTSASTQTPSFRCPITPLICFPWIDARPNESVAALVSEDVLVAVPIGVARADQALELFWRQLLAGKLPLQLSYDLVHAVPLHNSALSNVRLHRGLPQ
jgi:hypothetical protein